jgi:Flp pilus assembly protein TadG
VYEVITNRNLAKSGREGATVVELAAVMIVFFLLLFGILEYGRYIFLRQLVTNAARDGARFAVVNTLASTMEADTKARVKTLMGGQDTKVKNYDCQVYAADPTGKKIGDASAAKFGEYVAVEVSCEFNPVLPSFIFMNKKLTVQTKALMYCEAN